ncbi:NADH-quinone oxidoreductase subunit L [Allofrancisella guangzhouensis]|uniref:NADH:ubiquinone oxidoreductase subunit L n=1 Tax=Allofrancisella guangzhouensis TaxID=594679 RepID=A0A0A8E3J2_9GAMM|nr:NADH-quinone oxidoreductase subunit L [Allofrancisella guangzhouensis]AJC48514.1 NADH:ubiquinone oxidoreductase subunit L [Allofrancisella guangzhouensis]MBK2027828.1 NADH-quinone oxidoreductase subunit L [Allofrancisella guangzhouensis]MBK2043817.1 NADH-quinone oxidoreductase subunit L [Allofrancisella guangzhouensis]MBK2045730.1 NADH-quinone oxidoreductase subunit L [Allofrancisella guangzhouensis]
MIINNQIAAILIAVVVLSPLLGAIIAGFFGKSVKNEGVSFFTISLCGLSFVLSGVLAYGVFNGQVYDVSFYQWAPISKVFSFDVGFSVNRITVYMMLIVTFVSTLVHVYSIGYMRGEGGYARFFAYISGFTFAMLCLVMGNNFLLLFFGWEGVGLFSYLLIGFYFNREKANVASLRAFIVNRVGDLGFLLGIGAVILYTGSVDYSTVFAALPNIDNTQTVHFLGLSFSPVTLMCVLLFIGAMGKSAQFPLHSWLEGSMEGPTPISALIHAATMVTAGVFMVARLSPMFVLSEAALSFVLIIGAITCLFMGLIAIVQTDIKRVIAYCTLSQLGYMMVAQGSGAFSIGMFHLMTHAMFKALLFLAAGSVIVAMHHEQDIRRMGGLRKYMPVTYICMLIGTWSLAALPPFSGFFSKDLIIEAAQSTTIFGHQFAYYMVLACAFVTSFYMFRTFFIVFHGKERMSEEEKSHIKESPVSILIPLVILAIPSAFIGEYFFSSILSQDHGLFGDTISAYNQVGLHDISVTAHLAREAFTTDPLAFIKHSIDTLPFWLALSALVLAYVLYVWLPRIPEFLSKTSSGIGFTYHVLVRKYFIDFLYDVIFVRIFLCISAFLWKVVDIFVIDKTIVHGTSNLIYQTGDSFRKVQRGYVYDYAFIMIIGVLSFMMLLIIV